MAVSVKELTQPATQWRVGGVPLLGLLSSSSSHNETYLSVASEDVALSGRVY